MSGGHDPLLELLRTHYGDHWTIRRTQHLWVATAVDRDVPHAPTLVEPDVETFVGQLEDPPARVGRSLLSQPWVSDMLNDLRDGTFWSGTPPVT
ncbi:hypothetical protein [Salinactinospora qingdaonensis]|uniref:Uncharacterized protein n=1 Tax=Salinactinospora qingdaonensis TaxID=702744 RepID=A0ABP7GAD5_9ACTN